MSKPDAHDTRAYNARLRLHRRRTQARQPVMEEWMFSAEAQKKSKPRRVARAAQNAARRLYSIPAWPEQRAFSGHFSLGKADYKFAYAPLRAEAVNNLLQLTGRLTVTDTRGQLRALDSVRATLANTQGGVGSGPARRQIIATEAPVGAQTTSKEK